jgi:hypothetical protein
MSNFTSTMFHSTHFTISTTCECRQQCCDTVVQDFTVFLVFDCSSHAPKECHGLPRWSEWKGCRKLYRIQNEEYETSCIKKQISRSLGQSVLSTAFTNAGYLSLSPTRRIQSTPTHWSRLRSIFIVYSLLLVPWQTIFLFLYRRKFWMYFLFSNLCFIHSPLYQPLTDHFPSVNAG